ncbi:MAG: hypothetical protein MUD10_00755 [Candidatus Pacebacteria bacterium]|jgi:hypothetical protein|nr:hypothetical protein [Candidatus Paceibacterota bacterium]
MDGDTKKGIDLVIDRYEREVNRLSDKKIAALEDLYEKSKRPRLDKIKQKLN